MWNNPRKITTQAEADNIFKGTTAHDVLILKKMVNMDTYQPFIHIALRSSIYVLFYEVPCEFMPYKLKECYDLDSWNFASNEISKFEIEKLAKQISAVGEKLEKQIQIS